MKCTFLMIYVKLEWILQYAYNYICKIHLDIT